MNVCVFLGPSLRVAEARAILDAEYLPPAACGDVHAVAQRRPLAIAIIDGLFEQVRSVWHKEILWALSQGIHVLGAASMGALRAAELDSFGMVGVGEIYEAYRDEVFEDDDEVAVEHGPASTDFAPLSEAMVNLRAGLARACTKEVISAATLDRLVGIAKAKFYPERSWASVLQAGACAGVDLGELAGLRAFLQTEQPDVKRSDSIRLLEHIARMRAEGAGPHVPTFRFQNTLFWNRFVQAASLGATERLSPELRPGLLTSHVRLTLHERSDLHRGGLLLRLLETEAWRRGYEPSPAECAEAQRRLGRPDAPNALIRLEAFAAALENEEAASVSHAASLELARKGELAPTLAQAKEKWEYLAARGLANPSLKHAGVPWETVRDWYEARFRPIRESLDAHAKRLGFGSEGEFLAEVVAQYLFETRSSDTS
jgi:hypothetical protein